MEIGRRAAALLLALALAGAAPADARGVAEGGGTPTKYVALTFDDGPTGPLTERLLDGLRARYVNATFFLCGYRAQQFPAIVRRIVSEGHEPALHGQTHAYLHDKAAESVAAELTEDAELIESLTGVRPRLFRPPGGLTSETLRTEAARLELPIILWSLDPEDWNTQNVSVVARRIVGAVEDGDVILLHDLTASSVQAALMVIDLLQAQGYEFCTVSELALLRNTPLEPAEIYGCFPRAAEASQ